MPQLDNRSVRLSQPLQSQQATLGRQTPPAFPLQAAQGQRQPGRINLITPNPLKGAQPDTVVSEDTPLALLGAGLSSQKPLAQAGAKQHGAPLFGLASLSRCPACHGPCMSVPPLAAL